MSDYQSFLARKAVRVEDAGLSAVPALNDRLFPFQRDIVTWALKRGRGAIFAGTGLGKTAMQLEWARCMRERTGKRVLILTPLAVAQQTVAEAEKFGLPGIVYARNQDEATADIVVTNYDRVESFDVSSFGAVVLDESSIIKSHESQTRRLLIEMCAGVPYRLCCTATPAPNDYVELGNHAEFLGVLSAKEMLATWFVHDGAIRADGASAEWRLKGHAQRAFWEWVASWAVMIRKPSDLGYADDGYILPPLNINQITVSVDYRPSIETGTLFPMEARTLQERIAARRDSIDVRVARAAEIVNASPDRPWIVWCNLNAEGDALTKAIQGAEQVKGSDRPNIKTDRLVGFTKSWPRVLVTKPMVAGFGMNFQHCADMVFVGLNDSFEQLYQAVRRCWRFGQTKPVNVYMLASETEGAVVANLKAKEAAANAMADSLAEHMRDLCRREIRGGRVAEEQAAATLKMEIPEWLTKWAA